MLFAAHYLIVITIRRIRIAPGAIMLEVRCDFRNFLKDSHLKIDAVAFCQHCRLYLKIKVK